MKIFSGRLERPVMPRRTLKVYKLLKSIFVRGYYRLHIPLIRPPFLLHIERII